MKECRNNPLFTIVTVVYNDREGLIETMSSVLSQSFPNMEYIVIDGGSNDGTIDIIKGYEDKLAYWVSEPDKGVYDAMNKGIAVARGEYVNFMNARDVFYEREVLERVASQINGGEDVVFGNMAVELGGMIYEGKATPFYEHMPLHHDLGFNHQCVFVRTTLAKTHPFDLKYALAADYNMIIALFREGAKFQQINTIIALYDLGGISQKNKKIHLMETLMIDNPNKKFYNTFLYLFFRTRHHVFNLIKFICLYVCKPLGRNLELKGLIPIKNENCH